MPLSLFHRDSDHTGGASAVRAMQPQVDWLGAQPDDWRAGRAGARPAAGAGQNAVVTPCLAGQRWVWDGVSFEVLHPRSEDYAGQPKSNALSCVLRIGNGQTHARLVGNIKQPQEARQVAQFGPGAAAPGLQAELLLVPHHGSKTSSSAAFLQAVAPRLALVQAGYRNRFGHPAAEVLARYQAQGIALVRSDHCGAMHWQSAQPGQLVCQRQVQQRYWQHQGQRLAAVNAAAP